MCITCPDAAWNAQPTEVFVTAPADLPRLAFRPEEAATALGVSNDFFRKHIAVELPVVRRGGLKLYPSSDVARWLEEQAEQTVPW
jgi:hypothetical protein